MAVELESADFGRVATLAAPVAGIHASVAAVIGRTVEGTVIVDCPDDPAVALVTGPEGTYLIGRRAAPDVAEAFRALLEDWVYLYLDRRWAGDVDAVLPHRHMIAHPRLSFALGDRFRADEPDLPPGYARVEDEDGLGQRIHAGGIEVCRCLPDMVVGARAEIGAWTHHRHRRMGLALHAARTCMAALRRRGVHAIGWQCHASNRGSIALAEALGGRDPVRSLAYSASLPAENVGDLSVEEWRRLAGSFAAARDDIAWLGFHAACAWAAAGDAEEALSAAERLVRDGWQGNPAWLAGHWAMTALSDHPRLLDVIAALERR